MYSNVLRGTNSHFFDVLGQKNVSFEACIATFCETRRFGVPFRAYCIAFSDHGAIWSMYSNGFGRVQEFFQQFAKLLCKSLYKKFDVGNMLSNVTIQGPNVVFFLHMGGGETYTSKEEHQWDKLFWQKY